MTSPIPTDLVKRLDYVVKMARQYEAALIRVPDAIHGAGERLEQAKRELIEATGIEHLQSQLTAAYDALDEANSALQQFRGIQPGNGWDDELRQLDEAQRTIAAALKTMERP